MAAAHVYEILIRATRERVWEALTDPEQTARYFYRTRIESTLRPGDPVRYLAGGNGAVDGVIEECDPPHRLVMTWHVLYDAEMADEPPGRVEWTLTPANADGTVTRVRLRHGDLARSPRTWAHVRLGWYPVIDGLKTLLETGAELPSVDLPEDESVDDTTRGWHRTAAIDANNSTWELLDGRALTPAESDELLGRAYAAAHHWRRAAPPAAVNHARAAWLLSRTHAVLGQGELALHHAVRGAELTDAADDVADFDRAYAHEARARALACLGRLGEAAEAYGSARAVEIADDEDRAIVEGDLASEPWFGLDRG